jgi:hypothetical protein
MDITKQQLLADTFMVGIDPAKEKASLLLLVNYSCSFTHSGKPILPTSRTINLLLFLRSNAFGRHIIFSVALDFYHSTWFGGAYRKYLSCKIV